jgi:ribosomal protein S18 acetylase RimI-like enzyme
MEKFEAPLPEELVQELSEFWQTIPELHTNERWRRELLGLDPSHNRTLVFLVRRRGMIAAMCQIWISRRLPVLSEFTYPATGPAFRGEGIGTELWGAAIADVKAAGGRAIFLGTYERAAFRLYRRLGFSKLPATITFVKELNGLAPEEFLVDWFREAGPASVSVGDPDDQIPSYPLIVSPHDWQVLDANAGLYSLRYSLHRTFHGLYRAYERVVGDGHGARFAARTTDGRVVGMSTARLQADGSFSVDGFVHHNYLKSWHELIAPAIEFGRSRGAGLVHARVSREDFEKRKLFEELEFREVGPAPEFLLDSLQLNNERNVEPLAVSAVRMELSV